MIAVIHYEMGNVGSVLNMLRKLRIEAKLTRDQKDLNEARGIILPGVGSFDRGMEQLHKHDLIDVLNDLVVSGGSAFGICLGMQLMAQGSEEGSLPGLGWIENTVCRFYPDPGRPKLRIPHMGWNFVNPVDPKHWLLEGLPSPSRFYFVHSYHYPPDMRGVTGITEHITLFASAFAKNNILGLQFHPEKSHSYGLGLFSNFNRFVNATGEP